MLNKEEQIDEFWKTKESLCFEDFEDFLADQDRIARADEQEDICKWLDKNNINNSDGTQMSSAQIEAIMFAIRKREQRFNPPTK